MLCIARVIIAGLRLIGEITPLILILILCMGGFGLSMWDNILILIATIANGQLYRNMLLCRRRLPLPLLNLILLKSQSQSQSLKENVKVIFLKYQTVFLKNVSKGLKG
jgi:hypothetical protein